MSVKNSQPYLDLVPGDRVYFITETYGRKHYGTVVSLKEAAKHNVRAGRGFKPDEVWCRWDSHGNVNYANTDRLFKENDNNQGVIVNKNFDVDAFNKVLQASTNICAGGRADIAKAIAAGKGEKANPELSAGQVWQAKGNCAVLVSVSEKGEILLSCFRKGGFHILNQRGEAAKNFLKDWECIGDLVILITSGAKYDVGNERFTV